MTPSLHAGKYRRFELERRFLVSFVPDGLAAEAGWRISDRYIVGTRLRLRRIDPLATGEPLFKLGQKEAASPGSFARTTMTNIYLSAGEYTVFEALPACELRKRRYRVEDRGRAYSVDVFDGKLDGLALAEVECRSDAELSEPWPLPSWVASEVTDDPRYTGGALAALTESDAATLVRSTFASSGSRA